MSEARHFEPGRVMVHRDLHRGQVWYARAEVLVEDGEDRALFYWMPGAEVRGPSTAEDNVPIRIPTVPWILESRPWHSFHVLSHWRPGNHYSVWLFWEADTWRFHGWYVNLQSPFVRTPLGFDTTDDFLDVEIDPDGSWAWKDDDELTQAVQANLLTAPQASAIRREGWRAVRRMREGREPFTSSWADWRPDKSWPIPALPGGWESLPISL